MRLKKYPEEIYMAFDSDGDLVKVEGLADFCASFGSQKPARYILKIEKNTPRTPRVSSQRPIRKKVGETTGVAGKILASESGN